CSTVIHVEHDPMRDAKGLEALGRYMQRFTPIVAIPVVATPASRSSDETARQASPLQEDGNYVFLDLTGCERLFGGLEKRVGQIRRALNDLRIAASIALAATPGAAWALAAYGPSPLPSPGVPGEGEITNRKSQIQNLFASLPPAALRIDRDTSAALNHLG